MPAIVTTPMFNRVFALLWTTSMLVSVVLDIILLRGVAPLPLYSYLGLKICIFFLSGALTALTFWSFNHLGRGLSTLIVLAAVVEGLQLVIPGHKTSALEIACKAALAV